MLPWKPPLFLILAALLCGCGGNRVDYPSAEVSGMVTLDGEPLASGRIGFIPIAKGQGREDGAEIKQGKYKAVAVPLGNVRVFITSPQETGRMISGSSEQVPEILDVIPTKYRQGIEAEISGDDESRDFELVSP